MPCGFFDCFDFNLILKYITELNNFNYSAAYSLLLIISSQMR